MKRFFFLLFLSGLAIIIDGSMTYDLFDPEGHTLYGWVLFIMIVLMGGFIVVMDESKKNNNQDNSE